MINRDVHVEKCADEASWRKERAAALADDALDV
jgi:hypothetical protein